MNRLFWITVFITVVAIPAQAARVEQLQSHGITITAVEFDIVKQHSCDVYYWDADDVDKDAQFDNCLKRDGTAITYNPCKVYRENIVQYIMSGGRCYTPDELEEPVCNGFSPIDPRCK